MRLEKIIATVGVGDVGAVANAGEQHFIVTRRGFGRFDGNSLSFLDFGRVQSGLLRELAGREVSDVVAEFYGRKQEVWVGYRETVSINLEDPPTDLDLILKFNVQHNSFTRHRYTGRGLKAFAAGRERASDLLQDNWSNGDFASWESGLDIAWESRELPQSAEAMIMGFTGRLVAGYRPDLVPSYVDGDRKQARATRYGIRLSPDRQTILRGLYPECEGVALTLSVGSSWAPGQQYSNSTTWEPERAVTPGETRQVPLRLRGDTFALRMQSQSQFRMHAIGVEYEEGYKR
jgi:hypothetical protein